MYAIEAKMEALCDKLIEKGADINAKDNVRPLSHVTQSSATQTVMHSNLTWLCVAFFALDLRVQQWVSDRSSPVYVGQALNA